MLHIALALAVVAAAPTPNCTDPQSNYEMKLCAQREFETADKELNAVYGEAMKSAREQYRSTQREPGYEKMPDLEERLRKAQRAWLAFRDANCDYQYVIYYGGSMAGLSYIACKADMTKVRVKELKTMMNGGEDLAPPQQ